MCPIIYVLMCDGTSVDNSVTLTGSSVINLSNYTNLTNGTVCMLFYTGEG